MIQDRLDRLNPYFRGLKTTENYRIVELFLKKTWSVPSKGEDILVQQKETEKGLNYYMFYSDKVGFDEILDYIEEDIINHNLEVEEKERLLKAKVEELKRVFESKSLDELNNLKFTTEEDSLRLNGSKTPPVMVSVVNNDTEKVS